MIRNGYTFSEGDRPEEEAIDRSFRWIRTHAVPTKSPPSDGATSYGYKHKVEQGCIEHRIAEGNGGCNGGGVVGCGRPVPAVTDRRGNSLMVSDGPASLHRGFPFISQEDLRRRLWPE